MPDLYVDHQPEPKEKVTKTLPPKEEKPVLEKKTSRNPLSALLVSPINVAFENQNRGEEILLLLREHPVYNLPWMLLTVILFILPFFVLHPSFFLVLFGVTFPQKFFTAVSLLWYLFSFAFAFEKFLVWYFKVGIVTNERIVDIDFYGLLHKQVVDASIAKIQDVSVKQGGIVATFFDCGDVFVQTAGKVANIEFLRTPRPAWVADLIEDLVEAQERKHEF